MKSSLEEWEYPLEPEDGTPAPADLGDSKTSMTVLAFSCFLLRIKITKNSSYLLIFQLGKTYSICSPAQGPFPLNWKSPGN